MVPDTDAPLFWVLAAVVPSPLEQSTSSALSVLPVHLPVTVGAEVGQVTAESSAKAPELPHVYVVVAAVPPTVAA